MAKRPERRETGVIRKSWGDRLAVALAYPNSYAVGMSSLGFQTLYRLLNERDPVVCERVFEEPEAGAPVSEESGAPLSRFDVLAFSVSFENDYPGILSLLARAGIPLRSEDRGPEHPLVVLGGVAASLNPEPLARFVDLFLIGEAEAFLDGFLSRMDPSADREAMLLSMAQNVPGAYVPRFYKVAYNEDGTLASFSPKADVPGTVARVHAGNIRDFSTFSPLVSPDAVFGDSCLVEVSRGCPHGCRFCAAGYVTRPVRFREPGTLTASIEAASGRAGSVGLLGAAVSDLPGLTEICGFAEERGLRLSFSSFRAEALTAKMAAAVAGSGAKTATLAPEAGSERMRRVIKKGVTEADVISAAATLVDAGVPNVKLYFMVGLPTETPGDVDAIVDLVLMVKEVFLEESRKKGYMGKIHVSVASFVPKPQTPFQWAAMDAPGDLKKKIGRIKSGLKKTANVEVTGDLPRWAYLQGLLARGDRRVGELLEGALANGGNWPKTYKESRINPDFYVLRERDREERFPWDFIEHGVSREFLWKEWGRAKARIGDI